MPQYILSPHYDNKQKRSVTNTSTVAPLTSNFFYISVSVCLGGQHGSESGGVGGPLGHQHQPCRAGESQLCVAAGPGGLSPGADGLRHAQPAAGHCLCLPAQDPGDQDSQGPDGGAPGQGTWTRPMPGSSDATIFTIFTQRLCLNWLTCSLLPYSLCTQHYIMPSFHW